MSLGVLIGDEGRGFGASEERSNQVPALSLSHGPWKVYSFYFYVFH